MKMFEKIIQDLSFRKLMSNLGIEPAKKETPEERFDNWMKRMGNIHYHDHESMIRGYEIVKANNK